MQSSSTMKPLDLLDRRILPRVTVALLISLLLGNLSAVVDHFLHPEIPYFHEEHLIVGGVTFGVSALLFALLIVLEIRLNRALARTLETFLPICAYCKKIRRPEAPAMDPASWQRMEYYISEKVDTQFSHGVCPDCLETVMAEADHAPS